MNWSLRAWLILSGLGLVCGLSPSELRAGTVSSGPASLLLGWNYGSSSAIGFGIDRAASLSGPWTTVATVLAPLTTYLDTGLQASTTYHYRVWAYNAAGNSDYSNIASVTTPMRASSHSLPATRPTGSTNTPAGRPSGGGGVTNQPARPPSHGRPRSPTVSTNLIRPTITALGRIGGRVKVSFGCTNGSSYTLEYKNSLGGSAWTPLPGTVTGTRGVVSLTDSNAPPGSRFYRVRAEIAR